MMEYFEAITRRQAAREPKHDEYKDESGLIMCRKCRQPLQCRIKGRLFPVPCRCEREADEKARAALDEFDRIQREKKLNEGIKNSFYKDLTFDKDDGRHREVSKICCDFVRSFKEAEELSAGILFYGACGLGKTFHAASIGNALLKRNIPVLFSTLRYLIDDRLSAKYNGTEKIDLRKYRCFFIDDIGAEQYTKQDLDAAFQVVDELYNTKKPLLITSNMNMKMLEHPDSLQLERIYSRLLERAPKRILVDGDKSRLTEAKNKRLLLDAVLSSET